MSAANRRECILRRYEVSRVAIAAAVTVIALAGWVAGVLL